MTKKLIVIKKTQYTRETYRPSSGLNFAFVLKKDDDRIQASGLLSCREYMCKTFYAHLKGVDGPATVYGKDVPVDTEKLRIMLLTGKDYFESYRTNLFTAKAALNVIEEMAEFTEKSVITTANSELYGKVLLLTGSKEWVSCPQLFSLMLLILRLSTSYDGIDTSSFDAVEESLRRISNICSSERNGDANTMSVLWDKVYPLTKFRKEIFGEDTMKEAYSLNSGTSDDVFRSCSGVTSFITGTLNYNNHVRSSQENYKKIADVHLPRANPLKGKLTTEVKYLRR